MSLQRDLGMKHPIEPSQWEVIVNLLYTREQYNIQHSRLFCLYGITPSQFLVLYALRDEGAPLTTGGIHRRAITSVPGVTGIIDHLEKDGFVTRERCVKDRRTIYIILTDKGIATLSALDKPLQKLHEKLLGHLTKAEIKEFTRLLEKAREQSTLLLAEQKDDYEAGK